MSNSLEGILVKMEIPENNHSGINFSPESSITNTPSKDSEFNKRYLAFTNTRKRSVAVKISRRPVKLTQNPHLKEFLEWERQQRSPCIDR